MPPQPMMVPLPEFSAQTLIAGVSAVMQAIETWLAYRSFRQSSQQFSTTEIETRRSEEVAREADIVQDLVPPDVLESLTKRAKKCWTKYKKVLDSEGEYLPDDVDEATKAVKGCICRELKRIKELNVSLPDGILRKWWNEYCGHDKDGLLILGMAHDSRRPGYWVGRISRKEKETEGGV